MANTRHTSTKNLKPANISATQFSTNVTFTYADDALYGVETWGSFVYGHGESTLVNTSLGQLMPKLSTKEL